MQILVLSTIPEYEGTLLNQITHPGPRQEAEIWSEQYLVQCFRKSMSTQIRFLFIEEED